MEKVSKGTDVSYGKHSTQINLDDCSSEKDFGFYLTQNLIPEENIYRELPQVAGGPFDILRDDPKEEYGRENTPHVTVLFGLTDEKDYFKIREALKDFGKFDFKLGEISSFRRDEKPYDVLFMEINSDKLIQLHKEIKKNCNNENTFPTYHPHLTLAYIKKGTCKHLEGKCDWTGAKYSCDRIKFSHTGGYYLEIPLFS